MQLFNHAAVDLLPDAILFDFDGTLYPYEHAHQAALNSVSRFAERRIGVASDSFSHAYAEARKHVQKILHTSPSKYNRLLYFQSAFEQLGLGSQVNIMMEFERLYWQRFMENMQVDDEVYDFFDELRRIGIPAAIVTNQVADVQMRKLTFWELHDYFRCVITSEEVGHNKPHPAIFNRAVEKLGCQGKHVWMVGDCPETDLAGAKQALGATTVLRSYEKSIPNAFEVDLRIDRLSDLLPFITSKHVKKTSAA